MGGIYSIIIILDRTKLPTLALKPNYKPIKTYYAALDQFTHLNITHETALRAAFQSLLEHCARQCRWTLVPEHAASVRLGNRSTLEWIIEQYRIKTARRGGIVNEPNRPDDPQYILRLIGKVITICLETVKIVEALAGVEVYLEEEGDIAAR